VSSGSKDSRRLLPPDFRARTVRAAVAASSKKTKAKSTSKSVDSLKDSFSREYYSFLEGDEDKVSDAVFHAAVLDKIPYSRAVMRALLMARTPTDAFMATTEVADDIIHAYSQLFFDTGVFPNRLIKVAYAKQLPGDCPDSKFEKDMLLWGLHLGWEYIVWKISGGRLTMSSAEVLHQIVSDSLWRSREHLFSSIVDPRAKESRAWIPQALKAAELMDKINPNRVNSLEELRIRLIGVDDTKSIEDLRDIEVKTSLDKTAR